MKNSIANRRKAIELIKKGKIIVNGDIIKDPRYPVNEHDIVCYQGKIIDSSPFVYYMFHKPKGYVSANKDNQYPCVLDFFDRKDLSIVGRLDIDTTGLMILTNDKSLVKKVTLPQNHLRKKYFVEVKNQLHEQDIIRFKEGIIIDNDTKCLAAQLEIIDLYHCFLTIYEGKYHQVKKMFLSLNNQVLSLKRVQIGDILLDHELAEGKFRKLRNEEIISLKG